MMIIKSYTFLLIVLHSTVYCVYLDLREGKKCVWNGVNGTCVNAFRCKKAYDDIKNKEFPAICAYNGNEPIVCCNNCNPLTDVDVRQYIFNPNVGSLWNTGPKSKNKFNEYLDKLEYPCKLRREVKRSWYLDNDKNCFLENEEQADLEASDKEPRQAELLHTVLLGYGEELESARWLCGGSIISENYILTSANCTSSPDLVPVHHVVTGKLNGTRLPEPWRRYGVKRVIPHPFYRPHSKYHDIALIETDTPIIFSNEVLPISLHYSPKENEITERPAVAWSELKTGAKLLETLESVSVTNLQEYTESECRFLYPPQPILAVGYNHTIQTCYGYKFSDIDNCEGDNGASIFEAGATGCGFEVVGVTTLERFCGIVTGAVLYTRVSPYVPWIESIVWP